MATSSEVKAITSEDMGILIIFVLVFMIELKTVGT